jgi:hypothetical protein
MSLRELQSEFFTDGSESGEASPREMHAECGIPHIPLFSNVLVRVVIRSGGDLKSSNF